MSQVAAPVAEEHVTPADTGVAETPLGEAPAFDVGAPAPPAEPEPVFEAPAAPPVEALPAVPSPGAFTGFVLGDAPRLDVPEQPEPVSETPAEVAPEQIEEPGLAPVDLTEAVEPEPAVVEEPQTVPEPAAEEGRAPFDLSEITPEPPSAVEETVEPAAPIYDLSAEAEEPTVPAAPEYVDLSETPAEAAQAPFDLSDFTMEPPSAVEETVEPAAPIYDLSAEAEEPTVPAASEYVNLHETGVEAGQAQPFDLGGFGVPESAEEAGEEAEAVEPVHELVEEPVERQPFDLGAFSEEPTESVVEAEQPGEPPAEQQPPETQWTFDTAAGPAQEAEEQLPPFEPFEPAEQALTEEPAPFDLTELGAESPAIAEPPFAEVPLDSAEQVVEDVATPEQSPPFETEQAVVSEDQGELPTHHVIPSWIAGFEGLGEIPQAEVPEFVYPEPEIPAPIVEEPASAEDTPAVNEPAVEEEREPFDLGSSLGVEPPAAEEVVPEAETTCEPAVEEERQPFDFSELAAAEAPATEDIAHAEEAATQQPTVEEEVQSFDVAGLSFSESPLEEPAEAPFGVDSDAFAEGPTETFEPLTGASAETFGSEAPTLRVEPEAAESEAEPGRTPFDFGNLRDDGTAAPVEEESPETLAESLQPTEEPSFEIPEPAAEEPAEIPTAEEPVTPMTSTHFVLEDEPNVELAEFEIPRQPTTPVEAVAATAAVAAEGAVAAQSIPAKIVATLATVVRAFAGVAVRCLVAAGKAAGGIGGVIKAGSARTLGPITRFRTARKSSPAPAAGPAPIEEVRQVTEFEQSLIDRLVSSDRMRLWADQLTQINADTAAVLNELATSDDAQSRDIQNLIETMRSSVQEDARQAVEVRGNPYSLYWTLWLKDERESMAADLNSLIEQLDFVPGPDSVRLRLAELRDRYQNLDPDFYTHFGSLVLLYDLYPPKTVADIAARCGASRCGRALG